MRNRHAAWFAGLLLATPATHAQLQSQPPSQVSASPLGKPITVEALDQTIEAMRRVPWQMPAALGDPPPDESGRRIEDDLAEYFLTEPVLAKLQALRDEIAATTEPGAEIPAAKLGPMNLLQDSQRCRISVIYSYWHKRQSQDYHHDMILRLVARLPEADQVAAKNTLQAIDARGNTARALIAKGVASCDMVERASSLASTPEILAVDTREADYNTLRLKLVAQLRAASGDAAQEQMSMQRSTPCPAPAEAASGTHGLRPRFVPNVRDYYPSEAITLAISGDAKVRLQFDDTGCVVAASILESTGSDLLDGAALRIALAYEVTPGAVDGVARAGSAALPVNFAIHDMHGPPPGYVPAQAQP